MKQKIVKTIIFSFNEIHKWIHMNIMSSKALNNENNILHLLLQDLNQLDDDAKFWLT